MSFSSLHPGFKIPHDNFHKKPDRFVHRIRRQKSYTVPFLKDWRIFLCHIVTSMHYAIDTGAERSKSGRLMDGSIEALFIM
ncbi:hypothetical protein SB48_HM08orf05756 [Heyndrickxia coagulans]|uniref:Uncharacterized protein n=1 Tax=Heyndrickxia coagulans TaxID=1398 RepID=A0AAN0T7T1_HEYCO|nr:hypothetical protein SB48_HM08orf05756 [Heyndrickxia coagulans]